VAPAVVKVLSPSLIGATIPVGATTGQVQVVTPSGTLTSNVNFEVQPCPIGTVSVVGLC
jgi:succinyl-CoA synthetase alpha subunit